MAQTVAPAEDQLAALLDGDFLLTDARGGVSRFGPRAGALFGWRSEEILGRPVLDALAAPGAVEEWKRRLDTPKDPPVGVIAARARHRDGQEFDVEWLVVPVWLSNSLELSRMLEVVGVEGPADAKLARLQRDHPTALTAVRAAVVGAAGEPDDPLAGFILAFRARGETPWTDAPPEPAAPEPEPTAAAVVGPSDEQLLRVGELERELAAMRAELHELRATADQALALSEETRMDAERWRRELAERSRDDASDAAPDGGQGDDGHEQRPGFDDTDQPLAVIALDGRFEALNPAFCDLVGYTEAEFRRASWPSMADRENLVANRRLHTDLAAGKLDRARVETLYLHGQGLLVPVHGTIELVREDDRPKHLLLTVDR
jgi:PAS domain S-box-containing protein